MKNSFSFCLLLMLAISTSNPLAQNNSILSGSNVTTGTFQYEYVREQGDQQSTFGTITENIVKIGEELKITYTQELPTVVMKDSLIVAEETFLPIRYGSHIPEMQDISADYKNLLEVPVKVFRNVPNAEMDTSYTKKFEHYRFDAHWIQPILYALNTSEEQSTNQVPVFSYNFDSHILDITFLGTEEITIHEKLYLANKYEASRSVNDSKTTYWIDQESGRLLQDATQIGPDFTFWMRLKADT